MPLLTGTRLGPYEVLSLVGAGGMGEVYRARDPRLNREVAIKILPVDLSSNATRRARFEREAQAISRLSHPNICAVYDVGEDGGVVFLVMEYLVGRSLDARLLHGPLDVPNAIAWAIQIASALDAAHRAGVIHRDLKPANVMVTDFGIKLLDFGIAKFLVDDDPAHPEDGLTRTLTAEHRVVGTLNYMAPEQLEGKRIDGRADLFSLGALLYEMLTGRRAFDGGSPASVTAAVLRSEPAVVSALRSDGGGIPRALDHVLGRALAKDPDDRWQTARDLMYELQAAADGTTTGSSATVAPRRRWHVPVALALVAAAGVSLGWWLQLVSVPREAQQATLFEIPAPEGTRLDPGNNLLAVSPDGAAIAFLAGPDGGPSQIYVRPLRGTIATPILGTEGAKAPFWSPDGRAIGFYADGSRRLERVAVAGGRPVVVAEVPHGPAGLTPSAFWDADGTVVYSEPSGISRVNANGGASTVLIRALGTPGENMRGLPSPLPDRRLFYLTKHDWEDGTLRVGSPDGRELAEIPDVRSNAVYAGGYLLFRKGPSLVAQPFDTRSLRLSSVPIVLAEDVQYNPANGRTVFAASADVLAYRPELPRRLVWRDRAGRRLGSAGVEGRDWNPAIAPDRSDRIAVDRFEPASSRFAVWAIGRDGPGTALTHEMKGRFPVWSPDGRWVAYWTPGVSGAEIRRTRSDGSGGEEVLVRADRAVPTDWSSDGRYLLYQTGDPPDVTILWALALSGDRVSVKLTDPADRDTEGQLSPDGHWMAYTRARGGRREVWVQPFPNGGNPIKISTGLGSQPRWSPKGTELFYVAGDGSLMAVSLSVADTLSPRTPTKLFSVNPGTASDILRLYSVSSDGQRFLVSETDQSRDCITVAVHWTALARRAGG